jgi:glycosyltransferase involved in cell wall biosynthesis
MAGRQLLHVFSTFAVGGPQVRFAAEANRFGDRFRHLIVAMDGQYDCRSRIDPAIPIAFPEIRIEKGHTFANIRTFRGALRGIQPDVLVTYNWGAIEWAIANWPSLVRHVHIEDGFGPEEARRQLRRRVWTRRLALARSSVIVPSRLLATIATSVWRLDPRRVHYIPNGIDCARFAAPHDPALAAQSPGSGPIVGTVAALRREKNLARLLRSFRRACERYPCRLVIVGDGPERGTLEALADEIGIRERVRFMGHVDKPETLYRAFDIFALSSDTEQMPYTIIEAMAAGLPIAATDVGDIRAMVAAENAPFLAVPSDEGLADALEKLAADATVRGRVGSANRQKARQEYDQERMFAAYAAIFEGDVTLRSSAGVPAPQERAP